MCNWCNVGKSERTQTHNGATLQLPYRRPGMNLKCVLNFISYRQRPLAWNGSCTCAGDAILLSNINRLAGVLA